MIPHPIKAAIHSWMPIPLLIGIFLLSVSCAEQPLSSEDVWKVRADGVYSADNTSMWIRSGTPRQGEAPSRRSVNTIFPHSGKTIYWLNEPSQPNFKTPPPIGALDVSAKIRYRPRKKNRIILLEISVANREKYPVYFPRRFQIGSDILIHIQREDGLSLPTHAPIETVQNTEQGSEFILLAPGASFRKTLSLSTLFPELNKPGNYTIYLRLINHDPGPLERRRGRSAPQTRSATDINVWMGEIVFSPISLPRNLTKTIR